MGCGGSTPGAGNHVVIVHPRRAPPTPKSAPTAVVGLVPVGVVGGGPPEPVNGRPTEFVNRMPPEVVSGRPAEVTIMLSTEYTAVDPNATTAQPVAMPDMLGAGHPGVGYGVTSGVPHSPEPASPSPERPQGRTSLDVLHEAINRAEEVFDYDNFDVPSLLAPPAIAKSPQPRTKSSNGRMPSARQSSEDRKFGDFCARMESTLDDEIVERHSHSQSFAKSSCSVSSSLVSPVKPRHHYIRSYSQYTLLGHANRVKCVALAPSERYYVSCAYEDMAVSMHDVYSGKEMTSFFGHEDTVIGASFSLDSKMVATTSRDNSMILWDAVTGRQLFIFDHDKVVICCSFSHDSRFLLSGCQDFVCRVWDTRRRRELLAFAEHDGIIVSLAWAPDDGAVASASADHTVRIWDPRTGQALRTLEGHDGIVLSCQFSLPGDHVLSNDEKVLKVWEWASGACVSRIDINDVKPCPEAPVRKLTWTMSSYCPGVCGFFIVGVANDKTVNIYHPFTGKEMLSFCCKAPVYCLDRGEHSKLIFGDAFGNVYIVRFQ
uniref:Uncharacterized protein n=1 Tax=Eutreptiella gymnastica TaxID=73025 RepID=A0A6T2BQG3_9EUGL